MPNNTEIDKCLEQAIGILERELGDDSEIKGELTEKLRKARTQGITQESLDNYMREMRYALMEEARVFAISDMRFREMSDFFDRMPAQDQSEALLRMVYQAAGGKVLHSKGPSLEVRTRKLLGQFETLLQHKGDQMQRKGTFNRAKEAFGFDIHNPEIGRALVGMSLIKDYKVPRGNLTPDQIDVARALAAGWAQIREVLESHFRENGVLAQFQDSYWFRSYSSAKIESIGEESFIDFVTPKLDTTHHRDPRKAARKIYNTYTTKRGATQRGTVDFSRKVFYNTPEDEFAMWTEFADANAAHQLYNGMEALATKAAAVEMFGPNPRMVFNNLAKKVSADGGDDAKLRKAIGAFERKMRYNGGRTQLTAGASIFEGAKGYITGQLLSLVVKYTPIDLGQTWGRALASSAGSGPLKIITENASVSARMLQATIDQVRPGMEAKAFRGRLDDYASRLIGLEAQNVGANINRFGLDEALGLGGEVDLGDGLTGTMQQQIDGVAGAFHDAGRRASAGGINFLGAAKALRGVQKIGVEVFTHTLSMHRKFEFSAIKGAHPEFANRLERTGMTEEIWERVVRNDDYWRMDGVGKKRYEMLDLDALASDREAELVVSDYFAREVAHAVNTPSDYTRNVMASTKRFGQVSTDPHTGQDVIDIRFAHALGNSLAQFFSFTVGQYHKAVGDLMPQNNAHLSVASKSYKVGMTILPMLAMSAGVTQAMRVLKGKEPYDPSDDDDLARFMFDTVASSGTIPIIDGLARGVYHQGAGSIDKVLAKELVRSPTLGIAGKTAGDIAIGGMSLAEGDWMPMAEAIAGRIPLANIPIAMYGVAKVASGQAED
jgi:hypothetical protein